MPASRAPEGSPGCTDPLPSTSVTLPRRAELLRVLAAVPAFERPRRESEQIASPPEAAAELLLEALGRGDLRDRTVADLGCGPGILSIGAAWLGAARVVGIDADAHAIAAARATAARLGLSATFLEGPVEAIADPVDTVVMNPPFGAQRRHADRPFWAAAFRIARRRIFAFALSDSRTFIEGSAVARGARVDAVHPVPWRLPSTFPHHRKRSVELSVDLWTISPPSTPP